MPGGNAFRKLWTVFRRDPIRFLGYSVGGSFALVVVYMSLFPGVTATPARTHAVEGPTRRFEATAPAEMAPALADIKHKLYQQERIEQYMDEMAREQAQLARELKERDEQIKALEKTIRLAERNGAASALNAQQLEEKMRHEIAAALQNAPPPEPATPASFPRPAVAPQKLRRIVPDAPPPPVEPPPPPPAPPVTVLPAASLVAGRAVNGVAAKGNEQDVPFVIALDRDFSAPNDSIVPLQGCRLVAHATPEAITARARFSLDTLSCVLPSGETVETSISGWVTAADNMNGSWCEVFWNDAQIFKYFGQALIPAGLAALLDQFQDTVATASSFGVFQQSGSQSADLLLRRMGNILIDRAEMFITPVVWCPQNQPVHVYVEKGVRFDGITPSAWEYPAQAQRSLYD